jgi:hypothetical protein
MQIIIQGQKSIHLCKVFVNQQNWLLEGHNWTSITREYHNRNQQTSGNRELSCLSWRWLALWHWTFSFQGRREHERRICTYKKHSEHVAADQAIKVSVASALML